MKSNIVFNINRLAGILALLCAILWYSWGQAVIQVRQGDRSVTLGIPMAAYWAPLLLGTALSMLAALVVLLKSYLLLAKNERR